SYTNFTLDIDADGIALVTWDMPDRSMNVFTEEAMLELNAIVDKVASDAAIKGAVITSGKDTFSGGADITMLQKMLSKFAADKAKDLDKATKVLFDNAG
ncbi:MAG: 3-hydroxyacyl-CoA dehydrogenase, partial [Mesorhizobium sp.]